MGPEKRFPSMLLPKKKKKKNKFKHIYMVFINLLHYPKRLLSRILAHSDGTLPLR
ncbi:hypothetical protein HanRHA438_Chr15g0683441 [Helianthus annuus]|nr:hypothetical protein HanIR_Chr15g0729221 [Helianthus annuus]KAJ0842700.1 hypothetical protein HanRHA438_Chr15g0683441 [Helianthus annuus]